MLPEVIRGDDEKNFCVRLLETPTHLKGGYDAATKELDSGESLFVRYTVNGYGYVYVNVSSLDKLREVYPNIKDAQPKYVAISLKQE